MYIFKAAIIPKITQIRLFSFVTIHKLNKVNIYPIDKVGIVWYNS